MSIWNDPEQKREKKQMKCAKNAAFAVGGGVGLWLLSVFYPEKEGAEHITRLFSDLALCLVVYGLVVLAVLIFRREWALRVNALFTWIVIPSYVVVSLMNAWGGK